MNLTMRSLSIGCLVVMFLQFSLPDDSLAQNQGNWTLPAGGNSYLVKIKSGGNIKSDEWQSAEESNLYFFRTNKPSKIDLSVDLSVPAGKSRLKVIVGSKEFKLDVSGKDLHRVRIGRIKPAPGYVRVEFRGTRKDGAVFAHLSDLQIHSETSGLTLNYVKDNTDNRYYWGRRGPSVHLNYELPLGVEAEYFYNEVTVPAGQDPEGSYFMANGFGEGYFGMQVNGPDERRILFSVWSPFKTDYPGEIPETDKITLVAKGDEVHTGEFGNEGSGGQSYFRFPWRAGVTYRFLLKGIQDGKGNTVFTAWFYAPEVSKWQLIASFSRPKTDHGLTRLHSFLENFNDGNGYLGRKAIFTNQWCMDKSGRWFALAKARFTGDDIARREYRMDYAGGIEGKGFYLQNGGFFNASTPINTIFELKPVASSPPEIDLKDLGNSMM